MLGATLLLLTACAHPKGHFRALFLDFMPEEQVSWQCSQEHCTSSTDFPYMVGALNEISQGDS